MKEDQGDHFVKYLADTAALYMNSLLQFAKSQRNQKLKQICDDYLKTDAETAGKINGFAQMEVKLTQLRRIQDIDRESGQKRAGIYN